VAQDQRGTDVGMVNELRYHLVLQLSVGKLQASLKFAFDLQYGLAFVSFMALGCKFGNAVTQCDG
jgi:hypothetical protein